MPASLKVLVADDNPVNLRAATRILKNLGHTGALVTDGFKALSALEQQSFDVVLMDVSMPGMGGVEALMEIRRREKTTGGRVPVIMVTGYDSHSEIAGYVARGADGCLGKPLDAEPLKAELDRVLGTR
jgi:CheY-like chemotaxis protein